LVVTYKKQKKGFFLQKENGFDNFKGLLSIA